MREWREMDGGWGFFFSISCFGDHRRETPQAPTFELFGISRAVKSKNLHFWVHEVGF